MPGININNFTDAVKEFTGASPSPVILINWTPGENLTKRFVYEWTKNIKGVNNYGYKYKMYVEIWIKPVYMPWDEYPPSWLYPWKIPGNNVNIGP